MALAAGLFAVHVVHDQVDHERAAFVSRLHLLREAVDSRLNATQIVLQSLSTSPSLRRGDLGAFRTSALETAKLVNALVIVLSDAEGRQLVNTRAPEGGPVPPRAHPEAQERALALGAPQVSDLYAATIDQRPVISIEVPVFIEGQPRYVLAAGIETRSLSETLAQYVPAGFIGSIIDRNGIIVARQPALGGSDLVGKPTIPEVRARIGKQEEFWIEAISREGVPTYSSILQSGKSGWTINLAVPRSQFDAPMRRVILFVSGIAAAAFLVALLLARLVAGRLSGKTALLEETALSMAAEQPMAVSPSGVREYDSALSALSAASEQIRQRSQERDRVATALRDSETRWRSIAETLPNLVWTDLPDGQCDWLSSQWGKYTGIPEQELLGLEWLNRVVHPDDRQRTMDRWQAACNDRAEYDLEYRIRRHDGQYRWFKTRGVPLRNDAGEIVYWFGTCTDIEDIRSAEKREQQLLLEVNHRAKNMLGLVQAIARQSAFGSLEDFLSRFEARLRALAASQDLLVKSGWKDVPFDALVRTQLAHFADSIGNRIDISGPSLQIKAAAAQTFGIILHELSTNAAKYGALSVPSGRIELKWHLAGGNGSGPAFQMRWAEWDVDGIKPPQKQGFGSTVLQEFARASLAGQTSLQFNSSGLVWELKCPTSNVADHLASPPDPAVGADPTVRAASNGPRVLLVEDEALLAMEIVADLEENGIEVLGPAATVSAALAIVDKTPALDVAVLDVNLGSETSEAIARRLLDSGVPFVVVTGYSSEQLPSTLASGLLIPKPIDHAKLLSALKRLIDANKRDAVTIAEMPLSSNGVDGGAPGNR